MPNKEGDPKRFGRRTLLRLAGGGAGAVLVGGAGAALARSVTATPDRSPQPPRILLEDTKVFQDLEAEIRAGRVSVPSISANAEPQVLETRQAGPFTLTKIEGNWSNGQLNFLILADGYTSNGEFIKDATTLATHVLSIEPLASNREKFGFYALHIGKIRSLSCVPGGCNSEPIFEAIDKVTQAYALYLEETFVVMKYPTTGGWAFADGANRRPDVYGYAMVTSGALNTTHSLLSPHEAGHSVFNLADEYEYPGPKWPASGVLINCQSAVQLATRWAGIPGQPGAQFLGCSSTSDGYRDSDYDIMRGTFPFNFGPVDLYQVNQIIQAGPSRYQLPTLPESPQPPYSYHIFIPIIMHGAAANPLIR